MTGGSQNILCADIYAVKVLDMASVTRRGAQRFFGTSGGSSGQEITCSRSNYTGSYPRTVRTQRYEPRIRRSQSTPIMPKSSAIQQDLARLEAAALEAQLHAASAQLTEVTKTASKSSGSGPGPSGETQLKRASKPRVKSSGPKQPRAAVPAPLTRFSDEAALIEEVGRGVSSLATVYSHCTVVLLSQEKLLELVKDHDRNIAKSLAKKQQRHWLEASKVSQIAAEQREKARQYRRETIARSKAPPRQVDPFSSPLPVWAGHAPPPADDAPAAASEQGSKGGKGKAGAKGKGKAQPVAPKKKMSNKLASLQHQRPGEKPKGVKGWIRDLNARGWSVKKTTLVRTRDAMAPASLLLLNVCACAALACRRPGWRRGSRLTRRHTLASASR